MPVRRAVHLHRIRLVPPLPPAHLTLPASLLMSEPHEISALIPHVSFSQQTSHDESPDAMMVRPDAVVEVEERVSPRVPFTIAVVVPRLVAMAAPAGMGARVRVCVPTMRMRVAVRVRVGVGVSMGVRAVSVVVFALRAAATAPGEDPEYGAAVAAVARAVRLGVLLLVSPYRAGLLHLVQALPAGVLAAQERPAHLGHPSVDRGGLAAMATVSVLFLITQGCQSARSGYRYR